MSGFDEAMDRWVQSVLGVNIAELKRGLDQIDGQAEVLRSLGHEEGAGKLTNQANLLRQKELLAQQGSVQEQVFAHAELRKQAQTVMPDRLAQSGRSRLLEAIDHWLDRCEREIGEPLDSKPTRLQIRLEGLQDRRFRVGDETTREQLEDLERSCRSLMNDALAQAHPGEDEKVAKQNEALSEIIQQFYGIEVRIRGKQNAEDPTDYPANSDLGKIFEALNLLPTEHIRTSSLKKLDIKPIASNRAEYNKVEKSMIVDSIKIKQTPTYEFEIGGQKHTVKTLSMATLHEVGHAIDDKVSIMSGDAVKDNSYGGWVMMESDDTASIAAAHVATMKIRLSTDEKRELVKLVTDALDDGAMPERDLWDKIPNRLWNAAQPLLKTCAALKKKEKPWASPLAVDGVVYHYTYNNWYGYKESARAPTKVSEYQWRSPVEWFAELYAASWLAKAKPPSAVNQKVARYLYQG
jgi:hypothetical protein